MKSIYLVAYDVTLDGRRTKIHTKLKGYGEALQFSLFRCSLTSIELMRMRGELWELLDHATDRILVIDLGPDDGRGRAALEAWGKPLEDPARHDGILVV